MNQTHRAPRRNKFIASLHAQNGSSFFWIPDEKFRAVRKADASISVFDMGFSLTYPLLGRTATIRRIPSCQAMKPELRPLAFPGLTGPALENPPQDDAVNQLISERVDWSLY